MFWGIVPDIMTWIDSNRLLSVLRAQTGARVPFWFMRQAGRYLPEYRALREKAGGCLAMVYDPALATEVTLQPVRRFGMDAAILFSDILVVPQAMGRSVRFAEGEGPVLEPLSPADVEGLEVDAVDGFCAPVYETVRGVRAGLAREGFDDTALIGFAGAPWTVACYMVEGRASRGFDRARLWALSDPETFQRLMDKIVSATVVYLCGQVRAGAQALQIFDSWGGLLDARGFSRWAVDPVNAIVRGVRAVFPDVPFIGFPRGAGSNYETYVRDCAVDAVGLDSGVGSDWARARIQAHKPVQGNLDPLILLHGGEALEREARAILEDLSGGPFVFNLGHGIVKDTPPAHVARLCEIVRAWPS